METIVGDPAAFISNRVELELDKLGINVRGEPDWGDSEMELFLIRQALGEVPADRHPPNREVQLQLMVAQKGAVSLAEAAMRLQQKVGTWQRENGFVRRDFDSKGGFSTSVATQVYGAALGGIGGWMMAHRQKAPDVTLNLVTGPYFYGVKPITSGEFKAENASKLYWELDEVSGSAPGLIRVAIKNEDAKDWNGLLHSIESRYLAPEGTRTTTADSFYECEKLTLWGGSTVVEKTETSSGKAVENAALSNGFIQVLSSKIAGVGDMTHTGPRRVWMRVFDYGFVAENIELKLEWRALGSARWSSNRAVRVAVTGEAYSKIDLGEVRPETAILGEQRWEWRLLARARNGAGKIRMDIVALLTTEQYLALATVPNSSSVIADKQVAKSPTKVIDGAGAGLKVAWTNPENAKASDNAYATAKLKEGEKTHWLEASKFGFAIPGTATILGIVFEVERSASVEEGITDYFACLIAGGAIRLETDKASFGNWPTVDVYKAYGSATDLWGVSSRTPAEINEETFGFALVAEHYFGTGGGEFTASVDHIKCTVYYSESVDDNKVCFATRSAELRSDGVFRQHLTDEVWGHGVPDGFLPYAPPSGLEERAARGIIIPSQGNHQTTPDTGLHKLSAVVHYFPGYHFTSEAE